MTSASKEQLRQHQQALLRLQADVERELMKIPGVLGVGIGLKEVAGQRSDGICFRVYVAEKKPKAQVPSGQLVPSTIEGFATDVVTVYREHLAAFVEHWDLTEYTELRGGIAIATEKSTGPGTLGWFGTRESDNAAVLLTCQHVLYPVMVVGDQFAKDGDKVSQVKYSHSCCCDSNVIGTSIIGIKEDPNLPMVDCAIAKLNGSRPVNLIISNKTPDIIRVRGTDDAIIGVEVRKIGARSLLTRGIVADLGVVSSPNEQATLPDGTVVAKYKDRFLVVPAPGETYRNTADHVAFAEHGDSGSVIVDVEDKIVGMLNQGVHGAAWATAADHIRNVLSALEAKGQKITLSISPPDHLSGIYLGPRVGRGSVIASDLPLLERLAHTRTGERVVPVIRKNREEVMGLINHCRPVTVAWHRHQGPAFMAHLIKSARQPDYIMPNEVEGVTRETLLIKIVTALRAHGSASLRHDLETYALDLFAPLVEASSVQDLIVRFDDDIVA